MASISGSVGRNGDNRPADVRLVQELLNKHPMPPLTPLVVDGRIGPKTITAIEEFQRRVVKMVKPDGRVDPNGKTLQMLGGGGAAALTPGAYQSKPLADRVKAFTDYAKSQFGVTIGIQSSTRDALWQQRMHIAHMIKYNSFKNQKPRKSKNIGGHNLIDFAHLSDATLIWGGGVTADEFLRDAQNQSCKKRADGKGWVNSPDEAKTRARALEVLKAAGVATAKDRPSEPHSAMVACGVQGCAEPCGCGGSCSKHLSGQAVDLNRAALETLKTKLQPPTDAELDKLLAQFSLCRPMASEPWHVEAKK